MLSRVISFCRFFSIGTSNVVCSTIMSEVFLFRSERREWKSGSRVIRDLDSSSCNGVYGIITVY